jgi:alkaline phosphatase D
LFSDYGLPAEPPEGCLEAIFDPGRTLLGPVQKQLFKDALLSSTAKFKFVINEFPIQQFYLFPYDRWEGYGAERNEILNFIRDNIIRNVIFLTADTHANMINEVFVDNYTDPQPIAWEFVTGPIATSTLEQAILSLPVIGALEIVNQLLDMVGMDCRDLDAYSYGLVEVDAGVNQTTVTLKDDTGNVLVDAVNPSIQCSVTMTAIDFQTTSYLPVLSK